MTIGSVDKSYEKKGGGVCVSPSTSTMSKEQSQKNWALWSHHNAISRFVPEASMRHIVCQLRAVGQGTYVRFHKLLELLFFCLHPVKEDAEPERRVASERT